MKKKIRKILAGFFIAMMICTVIARAADSFTVAKVQTGHVKQGRLSVKYTGSGTVTRQDKVYQSLPEGQKIKKVLKKAGDQVRAGDVVLQLDLDYLNERIKEQSQAVQKLSLQVEQQELEGQSDAKIPETASAEISLQAAERTLNQAEDSYNQALNTYNAHVTESTLDMSEEEKAVWQQETEKLDTELSAALQSMNSASEAYTQAADSYHLAVRQEQASAENEAKREQSSQISLAGLRLDLEAAESKLQKLQTVQDQGGVVASDAEGIFASVGAEEGTVTTGSEQIVLQTGGLVASGILPDAVLGKVAAGDSVQATIAGRAKAVDLTIDRIGQETKSGEEQTAVNVWYASLDQTDFQSGTSLTYVITKNSAEEYEKLVPLSAIRTANNADYVLVTKITNGILGDSYTAVKVPVTVLDKDSSNAVIDPSAALGKDDQFIESSNKYVEEGDRVRPDKSK